VSTCSSRRTATGDHQGGLHFLARDLAPRELWTVSCPRNESRLDRLERASRAAGATVRALAAGDSIAIDDATRIECLHPPAAASSLRNDSSLVLRYDSEASLSSSRRRRIRRGSGDRSTRSARAGDGAQVPHHGSDTSSSAPLLAGLDPKIAVLSLGAGNVYGFRAALHVMPAQ